MIDNTSYDDKEGNKNSKWKLGVRLDIYKWRRYAPPIQAHAKTKQTRKKGKIKHRRKAKLRTEPLAQSFAFFRRRYAFILTPFLFVSCFLAFALTLLACFAPYSNPHPNSQTHQIVLFYVLLHLDSKLYLHP